MSTTAEVNIDCLRAAEALLRDHDKKIADAAEELKLLKRDRVTLSERVQHCIDILCGRSTPDLFTPPAVATLAESGPVVTPPPDSPAADDGNLGGWRSLPLEDLEVKNSVIRHALAGRVKTVGELADALRLSRTAFNLSEYQTDHLCALIDDVAADDPSHNPLLTADVAADDSNLQPVLDPPGPRVCQPVGEGKLADIPGIEAVDAGSMADFGLRTLADLEAKCRELDRAGETGPLNHQIFRVLLMPRGPFAAHIAHTIANAVAAHLGHPTYGPERPKGIKAPATEPPPADESDEPDDLTAEVERQIARRETKSPADERSLKAIAEWRMRQQAGDTTPTWGLWAEFTVYLADGSMVAVLYDPTFTTFADSFDFYGDAVSASGYRSHHEQRKNGRRPKQPLVAWAKAKAEEFAAARTAERAKDSKKRLKAPPKAAKAAKPKTAKAKVAK